MKSSRSKKRLVVLPKTFQEVLITNEIKYEKQDIDLELVRKLVYLYSVCFILF